MYVYIYIYIYIYRERERYDKKINIDISTNIYIGSNIEAARTGVPLGERARDPSRRAGPSRCGAPFDSKYNSNSNSKYNSNSNSNSNSNRNSNCNSNSNSNSSSKNNGLASRRTLRIGWPDAYAMLCIRGAMWHTRFSVLHVSYTIRMPYMGGLTQQLNEKRTGPVRIKTSVYITWHGVALDSIA